MLRALAPDGGFLLPHQCYIAVGLREAAGSGGRGSAEVLRGLSDWHRAVAAAGGGGEGALGGCSAGGICMHLHVCWVLLSLFLGV